MTNYLIPTSPPAGPRARRTAVLALLLPTACTPDARMTLEPTPVSAIAPTVNAPGTMGILTGVVVDSAGHPLESAVVILGGTTRGTLTGPAGTFRLIAPTGTYQVRVRRLGARPVTWDAVHVPAGGEVSLRARLSPEPMMMCTMGITLDPSGGARSVAVPQPRP